MKKKTLLMLALCTTVLALTACGGKETTTDATVTDTPAPTEAVVDDTADNTDNTDATVTEAPVVTEPTKTEAPAVTEPTVAPVEPEIEIPTSTPTEAPTPTPTEAPTPTPTEAPKELTVAEQYAIDYPFMEVKVFENVTIINEQGDTYTGCMIYMSNNSNEWYKCGYGTLKPNTDYYVHSRGNESYEGAMFNAYLQYAPIATSDTSCYVRTDELQICEDENCLITSFDENLSYSYTLSVTFFNADNEPVCFLRLPYPYVVTNVGNQLHVNISNIGDIGWATAKISYEVTE